MQRITDLAHPPAVASRFESLSVRDVEGPSAQWDTFVENCADATLYHDQRWKRVLEDSFPHPTFYLLAEANGNVEGVLPLVLVRSLFFGRQLVSLPFVDVAGVCATTHRAVEALWSRALELADEHNASRIELRQTLRCELPLRSSEHRIGMTMPLRESAAEQWKALGAKVRNQVRKAEKSGVRVRVGGVELLDGFYRVFARNMRDLGSPTHSRKFYYNVLTTFGDEARLHVAVHGDQVIAGAVALVARDTITVPWASSLRACRGLCPGMLLYWSMISDACKSGATRFDFGRSSPGGGTYGFKTQWGAEARPLSWQYWTRSDGTESATGTDAEYLPDLSRKRLMAEKTWKRLPLGLANWLGPKLRQHIPL